MDIIEGKILCLFLKNKNSLGSQFRLKNIFSNRGKKECQSSGLIYTKMVSLLLPWHFLFWGGCGVQFSRNVYWMHDSKYPPVDSLWLHKRLCVHMSKLRGIFLCETPSHVKQIHVYPLKKFMCTQNIIQPISLIFLQMLAKMFLPNMSPPTTATHTPICHNIISMIHYIFCLCTYKYL